jgi:hypothetical protein
MPRGANTFEHGRASTDKLIRKDWRKGYARNSRRMKEQVDTSNRLIEKIETDISAISKHNSKLKRALGKAKDKAKYGKNPFAGTVGRENKDSRPQRGKRDKPRLFKGPGV